MILLVYFFMKKTDPETLFSQLIKGRGSQIGCTFYIIPITRILRYLCTDFNGFIVGKALVVAEI